MPRDGQGNYSLPLNNWNPAVDGNEADPAGWNQTAADLVAALTQSVSADGQTMMAGNLKMGGNTLQGMGPPTGNGQALRRDQLLKGPNIASASTIAIPNEGAVFEVTGTTTISQLSGSFDGRQVILVFQSALQITHGPNLRLPGATNITVRAGDAFVFYRTSSSEWRCLLGAAATRNVGTTAGTVAAGDDPRITGLGTAATSDIATSDTDTTAGRLPVSGWMGLGKTASIAAEIPDPKNIRWTGFFGNYATHQIINIMHANDPNYQAQLALSTGAANIIYRRRNNGVWGADVSLYHTGNLSPVETSRTITGTGALTGGGSLSANRTIDATPGTKASLALADSAIQAEDLGNAAYRTVVAGPYDGTPGRLLATGSFGIGGNSAPRWTSTLNDLTTGGMRAFSDTAANRPFPGGGVALFMPWDNDTAGEQLVASSGRVAVRSRAGSTWGAWNEFSGLGVGQAWQNMTAQRVANTIYTNTSNKPIEVRVQFASANAFAEVSADGVAWVQVAKMGAYESGGSFILPIGSRCRASGEFSYWAELR